MNRDKGLILSTDYRLCFIILGIPKHDAIIKYTNTVRGLEIEKKYCLIHQSTKCMQYNNHSQKTEPHYKRFRYIMHFIFPKQNINYAYNQLIN